jgi:hypothetical protein
MKTTDIDISKYGEHRNNWFEFRKKSKGVKAYQETDISSELLKGNKVNLTVNKHFYVYYAFASGILQKIEEELGSHYIDQISCSKRTWDWQKAVRKHNVKMKEIEISKQEPDWDLPSRVFIPQIGPTYRVDQDWDIELRDLTENEVLFRSFFPLKKGERRWSVGYNGQKFGHNLPVCPATVVAGATFKIKSIRMKKPVDKYNSHVVLSIDPGCEIIANFTTHKGKRPTRLRVDLDDFERLVCSVNRITL